MTQDTEATLAYKKMIAQMQADKRREAQEVLDTDLLRILGGADDLFTDEKPVVPPPEGSQLPEGDFSVQRPTIGLTRVRPTKQSVHNELANIKYNE